MKTIKVGSRESRLAVAQARIVIDAIKKKEPSAEIKLVTMKTAGDRLLDQPLDKVGGKGLFVKELDQALLDGRIDLAVHSLKDMPMETDPRIPIVAVSEREDPRDVMILPSGREELPLEGPVGCSSLRRRYQLAGIFPKVETLPVRGNIQTRLDKLDRGEFGGLVLALAGIRRLGLEGRVSRIFSMEEILPAAGQGILAVQGRLGENFGCLGSFRDAAAMAVALAERAFVRQLDGGCSSPVAACGESRGNKLHLTGLYWRRPDNIPFYGGITGPLSRGEAMGRRLARELVSYSKAGDPGQRLLLHYSGEGPECRREK